MSRITLDLIRKRSEHNEGEISTLEEIALHQENIKKIELIDRTCKDLKILLLQHNLISKIENLGRLKRLEYLNLALNNIETIENLEGLESLKKLDLTINFIGDLRGLERLRCNEKLEQLFLMGNPCADYEGYREYAIATLAQLKELDGTPIERSARIKALQTYARVEGEVIRNYTRYRKTRETEIISERERNASERPREGATEIEEEEEENEEFWNRTSRHTPEERVAIAERVLRRQEEKSRAENSEKKSRPSYTAQLFSPEGRPYNVNQPKASFRLNDEEYPDRVVLEVTLYKYLDTVYVDVDVQPNYVRVTVKGKVLQLTLPCEVSVESSTAKRNTTNGMLVVTMPRLSPVPSIGKRGASPIAEPSKPKNRSSRTIREQLEIGPTTDDDLGFSTIVARRSSPSARKKSLGQLGNFEDSDVPPLE